MTVDKLVMACRRGTFWRCRGARKTEIRETVLVSHNLRQRGAAEAGDVKFAVEQRMGTAVILLQGVLPGSELYTDLDVDTAVAIPRDFKWPFWLKAHYQSPSGKGVELVSSLFSWWWCWACLEPVCFWWYRPMAESMVQRAGWPAPYVPYRNRSKCWRPRTRPKSSLTPDTKQIKMSRPKTQIRRSKYPDTK